VLPLNDVAAASGAPSSPARSVPKVAVARKACLPQTVCVPSLTTALKARAANGFASHPSVVPSSKLNCAPHGGTQRPPVQMFGERQSLVAVQLVWQLVAAHA